MLKTLLGISHVDYGKIVKRWPESSGIDILADSVYSICEGVVVFVGSSLDRTYVVNVQIDSNQFIRYYNLKSEAVSPNQVLKKGDKIGVANKVVRVEYCTKEPSGSNPVRIGTSEYYKHDPYPIFSGQQQLTTLGISAYERAVSGNTYDPTQLIKTEAITPYIATISGSDTSVNYKALKNMGVVGVMLYGGGLYNNIHLEKLSYKNPSLDKQVSQVEKDDLPYGLYVDVRARNMDEAKKECKALYYVTATYPPKLGIWLHLDLVKGRLTNDRILGYYYKQLYDWGLGNRAGLYVTKSELESITWSKYKEYFNLWLVSHIDRIEAIDSLLTPEFFKH